MLQRTQPIDLQHQEENVSDTEQPSILDPLDYMSDSATLIMGSDDRCVICRSSYEVGEHKRWLPCAHGFHTACIDRWVTMPRESEGQVLADCPTCKVPLNVLASRAGGGVLDSGFRCF